MSTNDRASTSTTHTDGGRTMRRLLIVVGVAVLLGVVPFMSGLVGSLLLYVLTHRAHDRLARVIPRRISAFAITVAVFVLLLIPGTWLVMTIVSEGGDAIRSWSPEQAAAWLSRTPFGTHDLTKDVASLSTSVLTWASGKAFALAGSVTTTVLNVFIALFGLYYLLLDAGAMWTRLKGLLPVSEGLAELLASRFVHVTDALLLDTGLTAVLQGTIVGVGFELVGLHPAVLWGFVTACVSILPVLGSSLVWLPGIAVLLINQRPGAALFLLIIGGGLASNLDNIVRPLVFRRVSGIHPMLTLVGAFAGIRLFGIIGAFIGPLVLSYFFELLRVYEEASLHSEGVTAPPNPLQPMRNPSGTPR